MKLDLFTILTMLCAASFIQFIIFFIQYRVNKRYNGIGFWVLGNASMSAGYMMLFLRGFVSAKLFTIIFANSLVLIGWILLYSGVMRFIGKMENRKIIFAVFAAFILSFFYYTFFNDDIKLRTAVIYSAMAIISILTAIGLFSCRNHTFRASLHFNFFLFLIQSFFYAYRPFGVLLFENFNSLFTPTMIQTVSLMFMFIQGILITFGLIVMVSQRLNSEMKEDKENQELIFKTSPDAVLITRLSDGSFVNVNDSFVSITGFSRDEVIGKTAMEINLWEDQKDRRNLVTMLLERGFCENMEMVFKHKNGKRIRALLSARIIYLQGIPHIISVARDIGERMDMEAALRKSELKYRSLIENTSDVVFCVNEKGEYQFANNVFASTFGQTPEYFIGKTFWDIYPKEHADYRQETSRKVFETGESQSIEVTVPLPDKTMYYLAKANPIKDETGKVILNLTTATDITDRKIAEETLRAKGEELERYFASSLDLLCIANTEGRFVRLNPEWEKVLGYTLADLEGKSFLDFVHPDDLEKTLAAISRLESQEKVMSFENRYRHKDGSYRWIEWRSRPQGSMIYAAARDVTLRKQAEEALRRSEEQIRSINNNMQSGMIYQILIGENGSRKFTYLSDSVRVLYGISPEEGMADPGLIYNKIHEDDAARLAHEEEEAIKTLSTFRSELRVRTPSGTIRWSSFVSNPKVQVDGSICFDGIEFDITERKKAEEALRDSEAKLSTLFSAMTEMVVLHELVFNSQGDAVDYRITDCNNAFTEITGVKREDAVGRKATEVYKTDPPPYLEEFSRVALTGIPFEYTTYYEPMDKHFSISVVSPGENTFATITTDITGIKQVQEVISEKNKELENYLYIASHDLRSPLVNIQGFSRRLQKQIDLIKPVLSECALHSENKNEAQTVIEDGIPKTLNFIFSSVAKMDNLLAGLLHVSRTGRALMSVKEIDMNKLISTIIGNYNFQLTELDAAVNIGSLPACYGDANLLNQLFSNIIGNAVKYRDKNRQLIIDIEGRQEHMKVLYSIRDNGSGIDRRHLEKIWDMFYRIDSKHEDPGEGLGLSIVKRIAERHNGKVWAESEPGRGSVFYVELQRNYFS